MSLSSLTLRNFGPLKNQSFDVVIVGGGISGAWLALHCSSAGYKTALVEQADYASQTSSASSKLLHSGIRYLQQMQFLRVRESALERAHYIYAAPHLSKFVPFVVPTYRDFPRSKFFLNCGMFAYKSLCIGENSIMESAEQRLAPIRSISSETLKSICPIADDSNTGAVVFQERHMHDSERMVLAILQSARKTGAIAFNYIRAESLKKQGDRVVGLNVTDQISQESFSIDSKLVVNAAGPWIDELNSSVQSKNCITGFAVGSHIICKQISDHAIAITTKHQSDAKIDRGGRHVFIIPWRGLSLIGTSYDEVNHPELNGTIQSGHVEQLLDAVNNAIPDLNLSRLDIISGYSGLYPLKTNNIKNKIYQGSGEYQVIDHAETDHIDGYITALGAKYTTGRKLSVLTLKTIANKLNKNRVNAAKIRLHSSQYDSLKNFKEATLEKYKSKFSESLILHLIDHYGSDVDTFVDSLNPELLQPICQHQPDILGQVSWAVLHEQAIKLNDVLFGRTSLGLMGISTDEIRRTAEYMATLLNWEPQQTKAEVDDTLNYLQQIRNSLDGK
ncbi:MAG: glycerol-3-phosphate dehydrogenase/oxidase [Acidiferrobacterales bacterium]|nr:glycerol-3-phosphate dehydrogenase/oxidase [Acidiferrobacterales bacterium]